MKKMYLLVAMGLSLTACGIEDDYLINDYRYQDRSPWVYRGAHPHRFEERTIIVPASPRDSGPALHYRGKDYHGHLKGRSKVEIGPKHFSHHGSI